MNKKLNIGLVGVGHLGTFHLKLLKEIENINFVGFYELDKEKASNIESEYAVKSYSTYESLLDDVEALSIVTPTNLHYEIAKKALEKGKHVFLEKPVTETIAQAKELIGIAESSDLKIQVGHIERFNPAIISIEKYNLAPLFIESHRLDQFKPRGVDVAVVLDLMIHDIDIILSLVKSPIANVEANGVAIVSDTLDIANARITFQNGSVANVTSSRISQKKMRKMRIFQKDAYISIDFQQGLSEVFRLADENEKNAGMSVNLGQIEKAKQKKNIVYEQPEVREINALKYELELFSAAVLNDRTPVVSAYDGLRALEAADLIIQAINKQNLC
jgi:predicted dehydrogenase